MRANRVLQAFFIVLAPLAVFFLYVRATRSSDFIVYYRASRVLVEGHGHLYGPLSGIGWPQYFRYTPLFLLVFLPFALLPYKAAVAVWLCCLLKCAAIYFDSRVRRWVLPGPATGGPSHALVRRVCSAGTQPGNVQFLDLCYGRGKPALARSAPPCGGLSLRPRPAPGG